MSDILTEIGDKRGWLPYEPPYDPHPETGTCRCSTCNVAWYARHDALDKLYTASEGWSDALVDAENKFTSVGDDPLFTQLHALLNSVLDVIVDGIDFEEDRIRDLRGE